MPPSPPPASPPSASRGHPTGREFLLVTLGLALLLALLFKDSFREGYTLFSNDGPLGAIRSQEAYALSNFQGAWANLNWLGNEIISAAPNLTNLLYLLLGAVNFSKFYAPISLLFLGVSAWFFFRQLKFTPAVCVLGALAAALNTNTFSNACWGLPVRALTLGAAFLALAALLGAAGRKPLLKLVLAGFAVGFGVMEGFDGGAIFSIYLAAFAFYFTLTTGTGGVTPQKIGRGLARVAIVAGAAAVIAAATLSTLIGTQIQGIAGTQQDQQTKEQRWDFATQWSLPKAETLRVLIPGLYGYRMDTPHGGNYWGAVGQQPGFEKTGQGFPRHSGSGEYAGVLVVLLALFAVAQSLRGKDSPFTDAERRLVWFWTGAAVVSLLLAWGRHAPFYRLFYALPYVSTIRNPIKFMHPFHLCLLVLFGCGLQALVRRHLESARETAHSLSAHIGRWWDSVTGFDKQWTIGSLAALAASLLGLLIYASSRRELEGFLKKTGFNNDELAASIAKFSLLEVGWFILFLILTILVVTCIMSGAFGGRRGRWAMMFLGLLLVADLSHANQPWISHYDYRAQYATNPVIDILRQNPHEQRVVTPRFKLPEQAEFFSQVCNEWLQQQFQWHGIQSLDVIQMPRVPEDFAAFQGAVGNSPARLWQLTNTRYLLTLAGFAEALNNQIDPLQKRFRVHTTFEFVPKPGLTNVTRLDQLDVTLKPGASFAIVEFTGALPRARLYTNWQSLTDDKAALATLANPAFDPAQTVLVAGSLPAPKPETLTNTAPGEVKFLAYSPKQIRFSVKAAAPSVLLFNENYHPKWRVWVDGREETLLRCNFLMRGVAVGTGQHEVEFRFVTPAKTLWVSLAAAIAGLLLCGALAFGKDSPEPAAPTSK